VHSQNGVSRAKSSLKEKGFQVLPKGCCQLLEFQVCWLPYCSMLHCLLMGVICLCGGKELDEQSWRAVSE